MASPSLHDSLRPGHLAALLILFFLSAAFLLQPLYLPPSLTAPESSEQVLSGFAQRAAINQVARVAVGAEALAEQTASAERMIGPLRDSILEGEQETDKLDVLLMRLVLYRALEMTEAAERIRERVDRHPGLSTSAKNESADSKGREALRHLERLYLDNQPLDEVSLKRVVESFGFIGRLARIHSLELEGSAQTGPEKEQLQGEAVRYLIGFIGIVALVILMLGVGVLLLIVALIRYQDGKMASGFRPPSTPAWLNLETFTLFLMMMIGGSLLSERIPRPERYPLLPSLILQLALMTVVFYPRLYRAPWQTVRRDLGLTSGAGGLKELALGPVGYVAALPLVAVGVILTLLIIRITGMDPGQGMHPIVPMVKGENASPLTAAMALLLAVVLAPVAEEITFRGFFYNALRGRFSAVLSIAISSAFFAGIHPQGIIGFPMLMAIGVMLAALREWRGSLIAPIVAHACTNGATMLIVLLGY